MNGVLCHINGFEPLEPDLVNPSDQMNPRMLLLFEAGIEEIWKKPNIVANPFLLGIYPYL